jgi:hypothetical protein
MIYRANAARKAVQASLQRRIGMPVKVPKTTFYRWVSACHIRSDERWHIYDDFDIKLLTAAGLHFYYGGTAKLWEHRLLDVLDQLENPDEPEQWIEVVAS